MPLLTIFNRKMEVFKTIESINDRLSKIPERSSVGLVPTMGALHQGHLSIVERAKKENDLVVTTIFVNPTQFDNPEDLIKYPNTLNQDLELLEELGCDIVFVPSVSEVYPDDVESEKFDFDGLDKVMEGAFRKGHFDGVGTIVKRLLEIIEPDRAYFGKKDYQQLMIIKKMVSNENIPVEIIPCEIYREEDGLAMSSRNMRLSPEHRAEAPLIYQTLKESKRLFEQGKDLDYVKSFVNNSLENNGLLDLEYFEIADSQSLIPASEKINGESYIAFIAVFAGSIRLIDNLALN